MEGEGSSALIITSHSGLYSETNPVHSLPHNLFKINFKRLRKISNSDY